MSAEEFNAKLMDVIGSQDKGTVLPFLKKALPLLRISIRNGEQPELSQLLHLESNNEIVCLQSDLPIFLE